MNLSTCTPEQRKSITCLRTPLLISAGAGSGKTFTLTQRIAYALLPESGPFANSIDEILAITFTNKAAAEIKARVKRTLRAEGLGDEALKVDGAWISTIHGMCARILRAHALDLKIDPAFGILSEAQQAELLADAIDDTLGDDNDLVAHGTYAALFDEYPARSSFAGVSVTSMVQILLNKACGLRGGLDAVDFGPAPACAFELARGLLRAYESLQQALEQAGSSPTAEAARANAAAALDNLRRFLSRQDFKDTTQDNNKRLRELAALLNSSKRIGGNFKASVKKEVKAYRALYNATIQQIILGLAYPPSKDLLALAHEASARYEQKKHALGMLDNDDLLSRTLLAFEEHPDIAARYENRFKLIMIDEFQDTSQLQVDMIERMSQTGCARLCTVGDAQQSIYRFRGADVNVYEAHKQTMRSSKVDALYVELTQNFRSHADILSFVDRVFGQPHVFGEKFMSLVPYTARQTRYHGSAPRIDLILAMLPAGRNTGVGKEDAKRVEAREIARRFAALRREGHAPRDMVVLLGKTTRIGLYADALRAEGLECVVTGGSQFASAPEVHVIGRFLEVLANPMNSAALYEVLSSGMMRLSTDDFLQLATEKNPASGEVCRRNLSRGFAQLSEQDDKLSGHLAHTVRLLKRAQRLSRFMPASAVVQDTVVRSGWMARLEKAGAQGLACAANILKAIRLIEDIESKRHEGLASLARAFANELAGGTKEAPGAVSATEGDVVRLMTIHAAKGLEFPIVALADFADKGASGKLVVETCGQRAYASLLPKKTVEEGYPQLNKDAKAFSIEDLENSADLAAARRFLNDASCKDSHADTQASTQVDTPAYTQAAYRLALSERAEKEELAEARRKLYVALTRASEALIIAMDATAASSKASPSYLPLIDDIRSALCGENDFPECAAELPYGGSAPARFERIDVLPGTLSGTFTAEPPCEEVCGAEAEPPCEEVFDAETEPPHEEMCDAETELPHEEMCDAETELFRVPYFDDISVPHTLWRAERTDVFSYSSIASWQGETLPAPRMEVCEKTLQFDDPQDVFAPSSAVDKEVPRAADSDKATNFGCAFHRAAQFATETGRIPDEKRISTFAKTYGLTGAQTARLSAACDCWFKSALYAEVQSWPLRRAEVPFFVQVGNVFMEGEIDLLCSGKEGSARRALILDYKTGGKDDEDMARLVKKHALQARCYAYALLTQGYEEVELRFVRVEHKDGLGEPQTVAYRFSTSDQKNLADTILFAQNVGK